MWFVALLSFAQVNVNELLSNVTVSPVDIPWLAVKVNDRTPVTGSYVAPLGVFWFPFSAPLVTLTELEAEVTNVCA